MPPLRIIVNTHTPLVMEAFAPFGRVIPLDTPAITREAVREADALIVRSETKVDRALLEGSAVRFVGTVTIGTDHVDTEYCAARGIAFASAPGSNANSVAEYLAAALLTLAERTGRGPARLSIGIVGVGNVGSKVARVARTLGMEVLLNDPPLSRRTGDPAFLPLSALLGCDILTFHVPLTKSGEDATWHMVDGALTSRMKEGSVLINTSRGGVADTTAVKSALRSGRLAAAILDVWEGEPAIDQDLLDAALIGTPHIAGYSLNGKVNAVRMVREALARHLGVAADPLHHPALAVRQELNIPEGSVGPDAAVAFAVRAAYDIMADDADLRGLRALPPEERARGFSRLRAQYRVRREFEHYVVTLTGRQREARAPLEALGFGVTEQAG